MDYEKEYNNALERAKQAIKGCGDNQGRKKMIYGIFPELAESEDERIRKVLCIIVDEMPLMDTELRAHGLSKERVLAWLEKQKEQKPAEWSEEDESTIQELIQIIENWKTKARDFTSKLPFWTSNEADCDRFISILKSIRPRHHWKPSEKQVGALKQWLQDKQYDGDSRYVYPILESLMSDLQKLL